MIDFRYHAISLAAVLVALVVGLLLGVTIGDTALLSNVRGDLERSLSSDLDQARETNAQLKREIANQNDFVQAAYPQMVAGHLRGQRVAVIGTGGATRDALKSIRFAIEPAGAQVLYAAELVNKPRYRQLAVALDIPDVIDAKNPDPAETEKLGRAVGRRIAGGREPLALRRFVFSRLSGELRKSRLFAFARQAPEQIKTPEGRLLDGFQRGIVTGLAQNAKRVVGVEQSKTDPSNIKWYNKLGLSTVDNIERSAGRYALVLLLDGAKGNYGFKKTADAVIPPVAP